MLSSEKPCIWYVSKYVSPPAQASAGGRGYMLMEQLAKMGYNTVIVTSDSNQLAQVPALSQNYLFEKVDDLTLCWVRTLKYSAAKSLRRILSWIHFEWRLLFLPVRRLPKPDVIVVSSLSLLTVINGLRLRNRYKCRLVFEVRDIWPLTITEEGGFGRKNPFVVGLAAIERLGYRRADAIVGTMPNLQEHVSAQLGYQRRVHCIPMGVDEVALNDSQPLPPEYEAAYIPKNKFLVAHVGSIGIANALDTFFECVQAMTSNSNVHFLVVGEGDRKAYYQAKYGHLANLTFAPRVPKKMVQSVLLKCDLLYFSVHVSEVWRYGQSLNKVIDYMLSGKPVVASYTGYPSMINEAGCGTYVPAGDSSALQKEILRYSEMSSEERTSIGKRGRSWLLANRRYETLAADYVPILFPRASD